MASDRNVVSLVENNLTYAQKLELRSKLGQVGSYYPLLDVDSPVQPPCPNLGLCLHEMMWLSVLTRVAELLVWLSVVFYFVIGSGRAMEHLFEARRQTVYTTKNKNMVYENLWQP